MLSLDSPLADIDALFKLIIELCLMSNSKLDIFTFICFPPNLHPNHTTQHWRRLLRLKSVVFKKRKAAAGIQGPRAVMSWLLACLPIYCVQRAISPPHASQRPHSKVDQGTPHLSFPTMQWKQTLSSASNKSQPVVAGWAADQDRPQVRDLRIKKNKKKHTVFLAANQSPMLWWVAHEKESGEEKCDTSTYVGGVEGGEPETSITAAKVLMRV